MLKGQSYAYNQYKILLTSYGQYRCVLAQNIRRDYTQDVILEADD